MRRLFWLSLVAFGLSLVALSGYIYAQGDTDPAYIGSQMCSSCHRGEKRTHDTLAHAMTLRDVREDQSAILADFGRGDTERMVQFPTEDSPRPFTVDDVVYVVGTGRYSQRFLYESSEGQYMVLPAEWSVPDSTWQPIPLADSWPDPAFEWGPNCAGCHTVGLELEGFTWIDNGVQCESCHGPGSTHAQLAEAAGVSPRDSELNEIRGSIVSNPDAQVCGQCHSQGVNPDTGMPYPAYFLPGEVLDTESTFALSPLENTAHWWASGHARETAMQYNEWLSSGHADVPIGLSADDSAEDTCLRCHSADYRYNQEITQLFEEGILDGEPPTQITLENVEFGVTCTLCHSPHSESEYFLVEEPYALCVSCHSDTTLEGQVHHPNQEMFEGLQIFEQVEGIPARHFSAEDGPDCLSCHMARIGGNSQERATHSLKPVLPDAPSEVEAVAGCTACHTGVSAIAMQNFIDGLQSDTRDRLQRAQEALLTDSPEWAKTILAFVEGDGSLGIHNESYTDALLDAVELELGLALVDEVVEAFAPITMQDPNECAECHRDEVRLWEGSPHAHASLNDTFQRDFADRGRPSYCMRCHASGYDPSTGQYAYEGVVCSHCHIVMEDGEHPPAPFEFLAEDSSTCGRCHSGAHAPTYDEWLASAHKLAGIDCVDCHTPHNNGLLLGDINSTCGSCHPEAMADEVHMGSDLNCGDCHMARRTTEDDIHMIRTGHTMDIAPAVCAACHGNTHILSAREEPQSEEEVNEIEVLTAEIEELEKASQQNWNTGIVGGAIGMFVVFAITVVILRRGKIL